jgi:hypothetical protein
MSDIDPGLDALRLGDDAIPPVREGLPPRYRMRADSHYVEQLDSSLLSSPIRLLEVHGLESPAQDDDESPSSAFIESIVVTGCFSCCWSAAAAAATLSSRAENG